MRVHPLHGLAITVLCASLGTPSAATPPPAWAGSYSNVCLHPDTGDLLGVEVSLIPSSQGLTVLYQAFEGAPTPPEVTSVGTPPPTGFEVAAADGSTPAYRVTPLPDGSITLHYLDGRQSRDGTRIEVLQRRLASWMKPAPLPRCR